MTQQHFEQYVFDRQSFTLTRAGQPVELRPKTIELLSVLIENRRRVMSKQALIRCLWHTEHVTDQSVFQAMSELRAALKPLDAIRTFPNRGYRWVLPIETVSSKAATRTGRRPTWWAAAAVVLVMGAVAAWVRPIATHHAGTPSVSAHTLPALAAFSEGAAALQRGDTARARALLTMSVDERPDFAEARLLLAEATLAHGDALQARQQAGNVLNGLSNADVYALVTAMDLISRADQQLGQLHSALEWAVRAADQAQVNGYECTAADLQDRVRLLVHDQTEREAQASPVLTSPLALAFLHRWQETDESTDTPERDPLWSDARDTPHESLAQFSELPSAKRPAHCDRYRGETSDVGAQPTSITVLQADLAPYPRPVG
ncbi:MAG: winged helix-turn-helix domain-containing protein [Pseudomonadota bacterium]